MSLSWPRTSSACTFLWYPYLSAEVWGKRAGKPRGGWDGVSSRQGGIPHGHTWGPAEKGPGGSPDRVGLALGCWSWSRCELDDRGRRCWVVSVFMARRRVQEGAVLRARGQVHRGGVQVRLLSVRQLPHGQPVSLVVGCAGRSPIALCILVRGRCYWCWKPFQRSKVACDSPGPTENPTRMAETTCCCFRSKAG